MAKKARTPAPPRKVQAPQRRVDQRRRRTAEERRTLWTSVAFAASGVAAIGIVAVLFFAFGRGSSSGAPPPVDWSQLVGLQTGPAPWNAGVDHLPDRLGPLGLPQLSAEGTVIHIHAHLDIYVNGKHETVPGQIGIYDGQFLTDLHTHDATGVMHVESSTKRTFSLGEFFGVWGVRLTNRCVGGYCKPQTPWRTYVNGAPYAGDPSKLVLIKHQEVAIVVGKPPKKIPSSYAFGGL
ncbi:MAG: hypothetical protein E6G24_12110 [Actinobacteria bacterium]|nr:MAG: hypothetical protein E6G24_12110 [Actinomycetota bacterium]